MRHNIQLFCRFHDIHSGPETPDNDDTIWKECLSIWHTMDDDHCVQEDGESCRRGVAGNSNVLEI